MNTPDQTDTLILVHPFAAPQGADLKLRLWWHLLDSWSGPLHVLQGTELDVSASSAANTLGAVVDTLVDESTSRGEKCLWDARTENALTASIDEIMALIRPRSHITLIGAFAEDSIMQVAKHIPQSGFEVSIDDSVLWRDDINPRRDAEARARLKKLMASFPLPQD